LILGSALFNFIWGSLLATDRSRTQKRVVLTVGLLVNLGLLGYFKYANFFVENLNLMSGVDINLAPIVLPLGISFFTFQQISFLLDSYRGETRDYSFSHYLLFVTFFPQLIAGPIVHHKEMMPQFDDAEAMHPRRRNIEIGLSIFSVGLFKKVILADTFALYAGPVFRAADAGTTLSFAECWLGSTAFALQLYFDFSGYSDMAIGSARLFGIRLPINFYSPYKAENIAQMWRRWHMTLTRFATTYIFMPMTISRGRAALKNNASEQKKFWSSVAYPLIVTFFAVGVWHGAGWNFAIWGLLQGGLIIVHNLWQQFRRHVLGHDLAHSGMAGRVLGRCLNMACVIFGLVFFKAATTGSALAMASTMLGLDGLDLSTPLLPLKALTGYLVAGFLIVYLLPNTQQFFGDFEPSLEPPRKESLWGLERLKWAPNGFWALYCATLFVAAFLNISKASEFIYFQF
jgi:D-alanyl-lipoteichoic acid acyltransferase DltB (MBOAT superfamily)